MAKWTAVVLCFLSVVVFTACGAGNRTAAGGTTHGASNTWSGYALAAGRYTQVSASWVQPSVNCSVAQTVYSDYWEGASIWAGLDGFSAGMGTVEQTGTSAFCEYGRLSYSAWYELWPKSRKEVEYSNLVKAGDKISASVTADGNGHFTLILADQSEGWMRRRTATYKKARLGSAEVIAEVPDPLAGYPRTLADFGTVSFTGATANGASFSDVNGLHEIDMVSPKGKLKAATSPLANGAFSVTWKHS